MKNLTICIPTHCIKTETRGQYIGIEQKVPSAPSSKLVFKIITDLLEKTNLDKKQTITINSIRINAVDFKVTKTKGKTRKLIIRSKTFAPVITLVLYNRLSVDIMASAGSKYTL